MVRVWLIDQRGTRTALDVDTADGAETLTYQIFSVAGVAPAAQLVFSDRWQGPLPPYIDSLAAPPFQVVADDTITVWTTKSAAGDATDDGGPAPPLPEAGSAAAVAAYQDACDMGSIQRLCQRFAVGSTGEVSSMLSRLVTGAKHVLDFEIAENQLEALKVVPVAKLMQRAYDRPMKDRKLSFHDTVLDVLCRWFKHEFFTWVNQPPCDFCGKATRHAGMARPTAEHMRGQASRVEAYRCTYCGGTTLFPRYNNVMTLLRTRRGRCGEWANCFTFLCRSMGYDARHVHDWTDHVWTEVWSDAYRRWIHLDSCEAAFDAPMTYETGWGKKLSYVIAMSSEGVRDVTRRYTKRLDEVLKRRTTGSEKWLQAVLQVLDASQRARRPLGAARLALLRRRAAAETRELEANVAWDTGRRSSAELQGRLSGSLEWRTQRSETGSQSGGTSGGPTRYASSGGLVTDAVSGGWQRLPPLPPHTHVASFGAHLVIYHPSDGFRFTAVAKLLKAGAEQASEAARAADEDETGAGAGAGAGAGSGTGAGGVPWRPFRVRTASNSAWPPPGVQITALTAVGAPNRLFAVDSGGLVWLVQAGPAATAPEAKAEEKASGRVWFVTSLGHAPDGLASLTVSAGRLVAVCGRGEAARLLVLPRNVDTAGTPEFGSRAAASDWVFAGEACEVDQVVATPDGALLGNSLNQLVARVGGEDVSEAAAVPAYPTTAGVVFTAPRTSRAGATFRFRLKAAAGSLAAGSWVGLHRVGEPSELVGAAWAAVEESPEGVASGATGQPDDAKATAKLAGVSQVSLNIPAAAMPTSPGLYELRLFAGPGFGGLRALSQPLRLVDATVSSVELLPMVKSETKAEADDGERHTWIGPRDESTLDTPVVDALHLFDSDHSELRVKWWRDDTDTPVRTLAVTIGDAPRSALRVLLARGDTHAVALVPIADSTAPAITGLRLRHLGNSAIVVADSLREARTLSPAVRTAKIAAAERAGAGVAVLNPTPGVTTVSTPMGARKLLCSIGQGDGNVTASSENAPRETGRCAFDGRIKTKWLDWGFRSGNEAWVAIHLAREICPAGASITAYALTSANDSPERDPQAWVLEGYPVGTGSGWVPLDSRSGETFSKRHCVRHFKMDAASVPCSAFRLRVTSIQNRAKANCTQLARIQLFAAAKASDVTPHLRGAVVAGSAASGGPDDALAVDFTRDGKDRQWARVTALPALTSLVSTSSGLLAVATDGVAAVLPVPSSLSRLKVSSELATPATTTLTTGAGAGAGVGAGAGAGREGGAVGRATETSSPTPSAAAPAPREESASPPPAKTLTKAERAAIVKRWFVQLTSGCGAECDMEQCASAPGVTPLQANVAAVRALQLASRADPEAGLH